MHEKPLLAGSHFQMKMILVRGVEVWRQNDVEEPARHELAQNRPQLERVSGRRPWCGTVATGLGIDRPIEVPVDVENTAVLFDELARVQGEAPQVTT